MPELLVEFITSLDPAFAKPARETADRSEPPGEQITSP